MADVREREGGPCDKACSIPNWAYHLFGGTLSLDTAAHRAITWDGVSEFREPPSNLSTSRTVCGAQLPLDTPSCDGTKDVGDWVEMCACGNLGDGIASPLRAYIRERQQKDEWFDRPTPTGNGTYGYHAVISIYLWDCAEWYDRGAPAG